MESDIKRKILKLKSKWYDDVDHLSILQEIYDAYIDGNKELYLLTRYFVNGLDELPNLKQKALWKHNEFESHRKLFIDSHDELILLIDQYFDLDEDEILVQHFHPNENLKMVWVEKEGEKNGVFRHFYANTQMAIESNYQKGQRVGEVKEWYPNGKLSEIGKYVNGEYMVVHFWDEDGSQILKDGTGKTIRFFGANDNMVYEQYFENFIFMGEKKIADVGYGEFVERKKDLD